MLIQYSNKNKYNLLTMSLLEYYEPVTRTLTLPHNFNECINKDNLPNDVLIITFEKYSLFNQPVNSLPNSITHLTFGYNFNQRADNLPYNLKKIKINDPNKKHNITKIPFDCILTDLDDKVI